MTPINSKFNEIVKSCAFGDFAGAEEALGDDWQGPGVMPGRGERGDRDYAVVVMLCGILTVERGMMGGHFQEQGKNMLSTSVDLFGDDVEGSQTARAWLATAYDRCGDLNEALALAEFLLESKDSNLETTVCAAKSKALALTGLGHPEKALTVLNDISGALEGVGPLLQGKVFLQRGMVLRRLGQLDEALVTYDAAIEKFSEAKSPRCEASAINNMGAVYMYRGDFARALVLTDKAIRLFQEIGDDVHAGAAWDMSAQISRKYGKPYDAERSARKAIALLEQTDRSDYLAEAYTTLGTVLIEIGAGAADPLQKAAAIYAQTGNTVLLDSVNSVLWDSVLKIKQLAKDTHAAMFQAVKPAEQRIIEYTLEKHNWHVSPAAAELKLTHRGLSEKLRRHYPDLFAKIPPAKPRKRGIK